MDFFALNPLGKSFSVHFVLKRAKFGLDRPENAGRVALYFLSRERRILNRYVKERKI